jgi:hypothetical protein
MLLDPLPQKPAVAPADDDDIATDGSDGDVSNPNDGPEE